MYVKGNLEHKKWLSSRTEPWQIVIEKWQQTYSLRQNQNCQTVHDFFAEWPILEDLRSDILVNIYL